MGCRKWFDHSRSITRTINSKPTSSRSRTVGSIFRKRPQTYSIANRSPIARLRLGRSWPRIFCPRAEIIRRPVQPGGRDREDLVAGRGDADGVLELRRQRSVLGDRGPAVAQDLHLKAPALIIGSTVKNMPSRIAGPSSGWP